MSRHVGLSEWQILHVPTQVVIMVHAQSSKQRIIHCTFDLSDTAQPIADLREQGGPWRFWHPAVNDVNHSSPGGGLISFRCELVPSTLVQLGGDKWFRRETVQGILARRHLVFPSALQALIPVAVHHDLGGNGCPVVAFLKEHRTILAVEGDDPHRTLLQHDRDYFHFYDEFLILGVCVDSVATP